MKKTLQLIILNMLLLSLPRFAEAQYVLKEADQQFELFNYNKAIDLYEQAYKKKATLHAAERLAESYQFIRNYFQAEKWYAIAIEMPESKTENILNYARMLQQNARYNEAKIQYLNYFEKNKSISAALQNNLISSCDSALIWMKNPKQVILDNQIALNSSQSDWGSFPYQNGIVFTSDRENNIQAVNLKKPFLKFDGNRLPNKKIYGWTGNGYLKLYLKQGTDSAMVFPVIANTNYHVGAASFTADGNTMYFTLTGIPEEIKNKANTINIEIYSSTKDASGKWAEPKPFVYNRLNEYSVGDPYISRDGARLYFASDMPGTLGGTDIFYVDKTATGDWGAVINFKEVNSTGNERTPYVDDKGCFYFSSDGRIGMGGLDIYQMAKPDKSQIQNMGYPINTPQDDFAFNLDSGTGLAYLSSNRPGGLGSDDIYSLDSRSIFALKLAGKVYDKNTNLAIANAVVTVSKVNGPSLKMATDAAGTFSFDLDGQTDYSLSAEKTNYSAHLSNFTTKGIALSTIINKDLFIEPLALSTAIQIEKIYYDFDKWDIRPDAAVELDKLIKIMMDNPNISIELGSHTDSRGRDLYNQFLSQKRAQSAVEYIISKGINSNRISAKGYGETQLLNECVNGIKCSEQAHQKNRRTEFKIIKQ